MDGVYGALADGSRRTMVAALAARRMRVKDLAAEFPFSLNATSKHLKVLERAGLVERQIQGREHFFVLRADALARARESIDHYERFWESRLDALEAVLAEQRRSKQAG